MCARGTVSRAALPTTEQWVRLEGGAVAVGLERKTASGAAFSLHAERLPGIMWAGLSVHHDLGADCAAPQPSTPVEAACPLLQHYRRALAPAGAFLVRAAYLFCFCNFSTSSFLMTSILAPCLSSSADGTRMTSLVIGSLVEAGLATGTGC
jgi:hypothetical protein